jgi:hypothetical protein
MLPQLISTNMIDLFAERIAAKLYREEECLQIATYVNDGLSGSNKKKELRIANRIESFEFRIEKVVDLSNEIFEAMNSRCVSIRATKLWNVQPKAMRVFVAAFIGDKKEKVDNVIFRQEITTEEVRDLVNKIYSFLKQDKKEENALRNLQQDPLRNAYFQIG